MRTALGVALLVAGLLLVTIRGVLGGGPDEEAVFVMTESLARDRDLVFSPAELAELGAHTTIWQDAVRPSRDGRYTAVYGPGQALAALPLYLLGRLQSPARDVAVRWACGLNPLVTALTAGLLCLWLLQLGFERGVALAGGLGFALATAAWPYAKSFLSEPLSALALTCSAYAAWRAAGGDWRWALGAGLAMACAALVRPHNLVLAPVVSGYLLARPAPSPASAGEGRGGGRPMTAPRRPAPLPPPPAAQGEVAGAGVAVTANVGDAGGPHPSPLPGGEGAGAAGVGAGVGRWGLAAFVLPVLAAAGWWLWYNAVRFGRPLDFGYLPEIQTDFRLAHLPRGVVGQLLSPGRGLLFYAPPALLAAWGCGELRRRDAGAAWLLAGMFLLQLLFYSLRSTWWGNWCWGPRYLIPVLPLGMLLAAAALARPAGWLRRLAVGLAVLGVVAAWAGLVVYNGSYQDWLYRQPNGLARMLWTLRDAPVVGHWRYLARTHVDLLLWQAARQAGWAAVAPALLIRLSPALLGLWLLRRRRTGEP